MQSPHRHTTTCDQCLCETASGGCTHCFEWSSFFAQEERPCWSAGKGKCCIDLSSLLSAFAVVFRLVLSIFLLPAPHMRVFISGTHNVSLMLAFSIYRPCPLLLSLCHPETLRSCPTHLSMILQAATTCLLFSSACVLSASSFFLCHFSCSLLFFFPAFSLFTSSLYFFSFLATLSSLSLALCSLISSLFRHPRHYVKTSAVSRSSSMRWNRHIAWSKERRVRRIARHRRPWIRAGEAGRRDKRLCSEL